MSVDRLTPLIRRLNHSMLGLAAIGGQLRLDQAGLSADPLVKAAMDAVLSVIGAPPLDDLSESERRQALGLIRTFFVEAADLLDRPERSPGWIFEDPAILQGIGASSAGMIGRITALGDAHPWFATALTEPGTFLDVGTGVGGLALAAAESWPMLDVVGIDRWTPSLALAERDRSVHGCAGRVSFQNRGLEELDEVSRYSVAWVPTPFIAGSVVEAAMPRLHRALRPGGGLVLGVLPPGADPVAASLGRLRTVRNGGHAWDCAAAAALMQRAGFMNVTAPTDQVGMHFVLGRRP